MGDHSDQNALTALNEDYSDGNEFAYHWRQLFPLRIDSWRRDLLNREANSLLMELVSL